MTLPYMALPVVMAQEMKTRWYSVRWGAACEAEPPAAFSARM
jgi:hypothetical protein